METHWITTQRDRHFHQDSFESGFAVLKTVSVLTMLAIAITTQRDRQSEEDRRLSNHHASRFPS
ncbi:hypothetical protein ACQ4M4_15520 [Leptolyngbya sp. AN02str]|uniref:hypothetical protein n=1 Tax=Leptolyngbya sp. AN02str TaxID=3423363 RepID=UPI003D313A2B